MAGLRTIAKETCVARLQTRAGSSYLDHVANEDIRRLYALGYFTDVQIRTDPLAPMTMPHVADISGQFYFKPESGGRLWLSPHDETPVDPCDAAPDELDVAIAIDRFEGVVDWRVAAVERRWAGLRSFAPDRLPVYGFDPKVPGFFWCAGQGGFGIQTAPAGAAVAASLLLGTALPDGFGAVDPERYSPARFP